MKSMWYDRSMLLFTIPNYGTGAVLDRFFDNIKVEVDSSEEWG
ncbi:MAG: hypothetical protein ACRD6Q_07245 [Nitrososphaeraceae archaeon]